MLAGRLEEARQRRAAVDLAREHQATRHEAWALWLLGETGARRLPRSRAADYYRQALTWPRSSACARSRRIAMLAWASVPARWTAGAGSNCLIHRHRSIRAMEMTFWLPRAEAELAKVA